MRNSTEKLAEKEDYQYPADPLELSEFIEGEIDKYKEGLAMRLSSLMPGEQDMKVSSILNF